MQNPSLQRNACRLPACRIVYRAPSPGGLQIAQVAPRSGGKHLLGKPSSFSFVYDGKPSAGLFPAWPGPPQATGGAWPPAPRRNIYRSGHGPGRDQRGNLLPDIRPSSGCSGSVTGARWTRPFWKTSCRWTWRLTSRTPAMSCCTTRTGSTCGPTDFLPIDEAVPPAAKIQLSPQGGRSSNGCLPFFNLQWPGGGLVGAIGWSGQWTMH